MKIKEEITFEVIKSEIITHKGQKYSENYIGGVDGTKFSQSVKIWFKSKTGIVFTKTISPYVYWRLRDFDPYSEYYKMHIKPGTKLSFCLLDKLDTFNDSEGRVPMIPNDRAVMGNSFFI